MSPVLKVLEELRLGGWIKIKQDHQHIAKSSVQGQLETSPVPLNQYVVQLPGVQSQIKVGKGDTPALCPDTIKKDLK